MQNSFKTLLMASCLSLALAACNTGETVSTPGSSAQQTLPKMTDAASYGKAAAEWQLSTINDLSYLPNKIPQSSYNRGWVKGAFYIGLEKFAQKTGNQEYLDLLRNESYENGFELGERYWHGDDQIFGTIYAGVIERDASVPVEQLRPTLEKMDHILEDARARYEALFVEMTDALISRQREDGYWPTSLDDAALFKNPETSGTAFFGFGLAWGINQGLLTDDKYIDARDKAWAAMKDAVQPNGMVGWVQQIGKDPQLTIKDSSQLYGVGGFLLMASEMIEAGE